jgi:V/A-type H+-transporting ATPase subunit E
MDTQFTNELMDLENNFESKIQKLQNEVDKEAKEIEEKAKKRAETKRAESLSKSKVIIKKDIMALKEKYYYIFMDKFNDKLNEFVKSNDYKSYLSKIISNVVAEIKSYKKCNLVIHLNKNDIEKFSDFIETEITKKHDCSVSFKTNFNIKGGMIAEIADKNLKIDSSLDAVLEDNRTYIMQTIFETLEAGDYNG